MNTLDRNTLFYGDNLKILRDHFVDECVDLIYLDPPFNSNRSYNILFKDESGKLSEAQVSAFDDTWHWGPAAEETYYELVRDARPEVAKMIAALREFIGSNQMMAYLVMMAARLVELHRVLKPTGSLYLHCDPTASHYLKVVLDTIFEFTNFRSEIVWQRTGAHSSAKKYGPVHDIIFYYSKSGECTWNPQFTSYGEEYLATKYRYKDLDGRVYRLDNLTAAGTRRGSSGKTWKGIDPTARGYHWKYTVERLDELDYQGRIYWPPKGSVPQYKRYLDEVKGISLQDIWTDVPPINSQAQERLGYPTQKPLLLLDRIIQTSSNPGDIILDPFCGCGTAIAAAHKLGRRWAGIDITHLAITLQKFRLKNAFGLEAYRDYDVVGEPQDLAGAHQLAREGKDGRYQFQWWALSLVDAKPIGGERTGKKGKDAGVDGIINVVDGPKGKLVSVLVQVKSGHVKSGDIRDLVGVLDREKAAIGIFITLEPPTKDMVKEATTAGFYHSTLWQKDYPRIQIITIEQLMKGVRVKMPPAQKPYKEAETLETPGPIQGKLGF